MVKHFFDDLIEIFDEEYENLRLITPQNTAEKLIAKGYRKQEWISVEERSPENEYYDYVLAWDGHHVEFLHYSNRYQQWEDYFSMQKHPWEVTHWMPLPEPPKGE